MCPRYKTFMYVIGFARCLARFHLNTLCNRCVKTFHTEVIGMYNSHRCEPVQAIVQLEDLCMGRHSEVEERGRICLEAHVFWRLLLHAAFLPALVGEISFACVCP